MTLPISSAHQTAIEQRETLQKLYSAEVDSVLYQKTLTSLSELHFDLVRFCRELDTRNSYLDSLDRWPKAEPLREELRDLDANIQQLEKRAKFFENASDIFRNKIHEISQQIKIYPTPFPFFNDKEASIEYDLLSVDFDLKINYLKAQADSISKKVKEVFSWVTHIQHHPREKFSQRIERVQQGQTKYEPLPNLVDKGKRYFQPLSHLISSFFPSAPKPA